MHASIGSDGTTWVVATTQAIYRRDNLGTWEMVPGGCIYVDVADRFHIVCTNSVGQLF
jgi:hypothetical protein